MPSCPCVATEQYTAADAHPARRITAVVHPTPMCAAIAATPFCRWARCGCAAPRCSAATLACPRPPLKPLQTAAGSSECGWGGSWCWSHSRLAGVTGVLVCAAIRTGVAPCVQDRRPGNCPGQRIHPGVHLACLISRRALLVMACASLAGPCRCAWLATTQHYGLLQPASSAQVVDRKKDMLLVGGENVYSEWHSWFPSFCVAGCATVVRSRAGWLLRASRAALRCRGHRLLTHATPRILPNSHRGGGCAVPAPGRAPGRRVWRAQPRHGRAGGGRGHPAPRRTGGVQPGGRAFGACFVTRCDLWLPLSRIHAGIFMPVAQHDTPHGPAGHPS